MLNLNLRNETGWAGAFTRNQEEGALPNGTRIVKCNSEAGDGTPDGTPGVILGSVRMPLDAGPPFAGITAYFVEWADKPRMAVGTTELKIRVVE